MGGELQSSAKDNKGAGARNWAVCLERKKIATAGRLRQVAGIEVCQAGEHVWLRGEQLDDALDRRLRSLPGAQRFFVLPDGQLLPAAARVPKGWLPDGPWAPLARWMGVELPSAGFAARSHARAGLHLVRAEMGGEAPSTVLLTTIGSWVAYAAAAPQVRLDRWRFAVASDGRVVVRGAPLPPLAGERFVEQEGIAVPAGWRWSPPVEAAVVRELLQLEGADLALWRPDAPWERIAAEHFARATRSAVRATADNLTVER